MNESPAFSRSGATSAEGKLDSRVDIPVATALEEKLIALAVFHGKPRAEYARILLVKGVEGELAYLRSIGAFPGSRDGSNNP